jgi:hypothetical protein
MEVYRVLGRPHSGARECHAGEGVYIRVLERVEV